MTPAGPEGGRHPGVASGSRQGWGDDRVHWHELFNLNAMATTTPIGLDGGVGPEGPHGRDRDGAMAARSRSSRGDVPRSRACRGAAEPRVVGAARAARAAGARPTGLGRTAAREQLEARGRGGGRIKFGASGIDYIKLSLSVTF
jgi:hypothetical protein